MFDIGWTELLVIAVVLIVVVGPKDLPPMLRAFGKTVTRFRKVAGEFRAQFDEALREADLDDVRQHIADAQKLNPANSLREAMNPLRQMGNEIKADLQRSTSIDRPQAAETPLLTATPVATEHPESIAPVITPAPEAIAETPSAKPRTTRKPRAKVADIAVVEPSQVATAETATKPRRAPRKAVAEAAVADMAAVETIAPKKASTRSKAAAEKTAIAMLVEPAQVEVPAATVKAKRTPRKAAPAPVAEETPEAVKKPATPRKSAKKKDDA